MGIVGPRVLNYLTEVQGRRPRRSRSRASPARSTSSSSTPDAIRTTRRARARWCAGPATSFVVERAVSAGAASCRPIRGTTLTSIARPDRTAPIDILSVWRRMGPKVEPGAGLDITSWTALTSTAPTPAALHAARGRVRGRHRGAAGGHRDPGAAARHLARAGLEVLRGRCRRCSPRPTAMSAIRNRTRGRDRGRRRRARAALRRDRPRAAPARRT